MYRRSVCAIFPGAYAEQSDNKNIQLENGLIKLLHEIPTKATAKYSTN
jgi:hypothetical protein